MSEKETFTLKNLTKAKLPRLAFAQMKEAVLGAEYDLSVTIVDEEKMRELNYTYRKIDKATDILSFPLSETEGEIFINLEETKKEAPKFDRDFENFLGFLFIHGLVHLKGHDHSDEMESLEKKYRKQFEI